MTDTVNEARAEVKPPIPVTPSTLPDQLFAFLRVMGALITLGIAVLGFLKNRDIAGLVNFVKSSDLIQVATTAIGLGLVIYGNLKTRWRKQQLIVAAAAAPDSVAYIARK